MSSRRMNLIYDGYTKKKTILAWQFVITFQIKMNIFDFRTNSKVNFNRLATLWWRVFKDVP